MNFLFISTTHTFYDLAWVLKNMGHNVETMDEYRFDPLIKNEVEKSFLFEKLSKDHYDYVISSLFIPEVSDICEDLGNVYVSWIYDSPLISLFNESVLNSCNYIFIFDHCEYLRVKNLGVKNVFHLPLAANLNRSGALNITKSDVKSYSHDISFVGKLYEENNYNEVIHILPENISLPLKSYLIRNLCKWDEPKPWPIVNEDCLNYYSSHFDNLNFPKLMNKSEFLGIFILSRKLAEMDRLTILNTIAESNRVDLYTQSISPYLENIFVHNQVDYYTDMYKIFHLSKINLNITLPSIESGIPLRIFDILSCGGFVLSNDQPELEELFIKGKEIETFKSLQELKDKTSYYLKHDEERKKIGINGYLKVRNNYTYEKQIKKILDILPK